MPIRFCPHCGRRALTFEQEMLRPPPTVMRTCCAVGCPLEGHTLSDRGVDLALYGAHRNFEVLTGRVVDSSGARSESNE